MLNEYPNRELLDTLNLHVLSGRTMGFGAGLYSNRVGYAPWVWERRGVNRYELWRIH